MKTEDVIKKLENLEYPEIEPASHKRRLKAVLLSSGVFHRGGDRSFLRIDSRGVELSLSRSILIPAGIFILAALALIPWVVSSYHNPDQHTAVSLSPVTAAGENQLPLIINEPMDNASVTSQTITVQGTTVPGAVVSVNDEITIADEQGNFSVDLGLDTGINVISVTASDDSGGQTAATIVANLEEGA